MNDRRNSELTRRAFLKITSVSVGAASVGAIGLNSSAQPKPSSEISHLANLNGNWIGYNPVVARRCLSNGAESRLDWKKAKWFWTNELPVKDASVKGTFPAGRRYFRWTVILPDAKEINSAWVQFVADDFGEIYINGQKRSECRTWKQPVERYIRDFVRPGKNVFGMAVLNNGGPAGWAVKLCVQMDHGTVLEFVPEQSSVVWNTHVDSDGKWAASDFSESNWFPVKELGKVGIDPWGEVKPSGFMPGSYQSAPSPLLRRKFTVRRRLRQAVLRSCGLGCHEVYCNGVKVGDAVLDPAMTQYDKTILYSEHDITKLLKQDENVLGVMMGHGWFGETSSTTWNFDLARWHDRPKLWLNLRLEYEDGTIDTIITDSTWKAALSPVLTDDFMNGEVYDARAELPGWATPSFDDSAWASVVQMAPPGGQLRPQTIAPMRVTETVHPVKVWKATDDVFIFDLGQNIAGWARIRVKGATGREIKLRFGEELQNGRIIRELGGLTWSGWFQEDRYVLKGSGVEEWEPRFTYHGFRYVEVEGWPGTPELSDLDGRVVHTDFKSVGAFSCSNKLLNAIQKSILWSYRGNFFGFPTDCPTREKKGWTGDAHLACEQAMYNWDNKAGYEKWMQDFTDVQDGQGALKTVIPSPDWGGDETDWDVAALMIPWYVYVYTGDLDIVRASYPMMKKWAQFHARKAKDFIQFSGVSDWCPAKTRTPIEVTSTCYYYGGLVRLIKMALLLGRTGDAKVFEQEAKSIQHSFQQKFLKSNGIVAEGSQAAQACALYYGLIPENQRAAVAKVLSEAVTAANDHVDVGILGAKTLFRVLSDNGYHEQAYRVVTSKGAPGYGWMIESGYTCLSEDWYGGGSHNHVMFGDISAWFYQYLAGIQADPEVPGFKHFILRPQPAGDLTWVKAEHKSPYGLIQANWEKQSNDQFKARFVIPEGTTATLILPGCSPEKVNPGTIERTWRNV